MRSRLVLWIVLFVAAFPAAAQQWKRVEAGGFTVYSDAGDSRAEAAAAHLVEVRAAFRAVSGDQAVSPIPVRVFLFANEEEFRRYRPNPIEGGFFQGGPEGNYVLTAVSADTDRILSHEYAHVVMNHTMPRTPQWLEEGSAEYFSTISVDGDVVRVGEPVASRQRALAALKWMDAAEFAAIDNRTLFVQDAERISVFYAQSWALVHMLRTAEPYRGSMGVFLSLLAEAVPADEAFERAFSRTLAEALDDLRDYVSAGDWRVETIEMAAPPEPAQLAAVRMTPTDTDLALLDLRMSLGLWDVSEGELRRLAALKDQTPATETARALIALSQDDSAAAEQHFQKAIDEGSRQSSTYFEYAMLLRDEGESPGRVRSLLERAVELNPSHAEAQFLLGVMASTEGRNEDAIRSLEAAVAVQPRQSSFWHALAMAYWDAGDRDQAIEAASQARAAADSTPEREMAEAELSMMRRPEPVARPAATRPEVSTPESWFNRQGSQRVEGVLTRIECNGGSARLHVRTAQSEVALDVADPDKVVMRNAGGREVAFSCGDQKQRPVVVEHTLSGEVTAIEFR